MARSFRVRRQYPVTVQCAVIFTIFAELFSGTKGDSLHLTTAVYRPAEAGRYDVSFACFHSNPDTDVTLSFGRPFPIGLPGAGIETSTSLPDGTIETELNGHVLQRLPTDVNATGLYYCQGFKRDMTTTVYNIIQNYDRWFFVADGRVTRTINKGENVTLSVNNYRSSTTYASWRLIRNGVVSNLSAYDGMATVTIPPDQIKHGDLYAVVNSQVGQTLRDNKFTMIRLIVRGCAAGKWGPPDCVGVCDLCYNGGVCDDKTGDCICPPGFMGPNCLTACSGSSFGKECELRCGSGELISYCYSAQFGLPDPYGVSCYNGRRGTRCNGGMRSSRKPYYYMDQNQGVFTD